MHRTKERTPRHDDATGADRTPREIELKLFVPPSSASRVWRHPLLVDHAGPAARVVESRYFDTPDGDLARRRMALRLRRDDGRWVQTLKVAAPDERALSTRGEWEHAVDGPRLDLASLAGTPFAALDADVASRLQPVFTTTFRRETKGVAIDGATVEVAFDVGDVEAGRGRTVRSLPIHELEIEVKRGEVPDLLRFAARLAKDLPLIPLADSKAARGHRLATGAALEASWVALPVAEPGATLRMHLARVLAAGNRALLANAHALFERGPDDPDAALEFVHQARVAVRRLRSALELFEPALGDRRSRALAKRLGRIGRVFGAARDQDVLATTTLARIERHAVDDDASRRAFATLCDLAAAKRRDAHRGLMRFVDAGSFGATTIAVERMADRLAHAKTDAPLQPCAAAWLTERLRCIVPRARRIAVLDERQRHRLRIEVKRLRYALDLFEGLYDAAAVAAYRDALADLQDRLGGMTDAAVAARLLANWSDEAPIAVVASRYDTWRRAKLRGQLPRVAALAAALELAPAPWRDPDAGAAG